MAELIENDTIPVAPNACDFLNRSSIHCRDVVESHDWFILFDICTDQILVLDLSTGWLDVKRLTFHIHQNSLNQGESGESPIQRRKKFFRNKKLRKDT